MLLNYETFQAFRGGSRIFLRRGAPLRNDVTDGEAINFKSEYGYTKEKASSQGRGVRTPCTLPLDLPLGFIVDEFQDLMSW